MIKCKMRIMLLVSYKYLIQQVILILLVVGTNISASQIPKCLAPPTSTTVLNAVPVTSLLSLETAMHSLSAAFRVVSQPTGGAKKGQPWLHTEATVFYFHSFDPTAQSKAFFPDAQAAIVVGQDNESNVSSAWLGVISSPSTPYKSILSFSPVRQVAGSTFKFLIDFGPLVSDVDTEFKNIWTSLYLPLAYVNHNLNLSEQVLGGQGQVSGAATASQALSNQNTNIYGALPSSVLTAMAMDDLQWRLGWNFHSSQRLMSGIYFILFIPMGRKATGQFLFEPVIGLQGHWAPGLGMTNNLLLFRHPNAVLSFIWELRWNYIMTGIETRTFDLNNGDWSRYLLVSNITNSVQPVAAGNFFTRDAIVTPRSMVDFLMALNYQTDRLNLELGYDLWWRQAEKLTLAPNSQAFAEAFALLGLVPGQSSQLVLYDLTGCCPKTSLSVATICQGIPNSLVYSDNEPVAITNANLNLASGTKPGVMFMKCYAGASYLAKKLPASIGLAISSEFVVPNNSLKTWGAWMKASCSF